MDKEEHIGPHVVLITDMVVKALSNKTHTNEYSFKQRYSIHKPIYYM